MFPASIPSYDSFTTPITLAEMQHTSRHRQMEQNIVALATKVGIDASADTASLTYKLGQAATRTGLETLTNKIIGDGSTIGSTVDVTEVLKKVYPVGSIYISTVSTNPALLFAFGTWVAFATGRTLVGIDAGQTEFDTVEETGGAKTHTLTEAQLPAHRHLLWAPVVVTVTPVSLTNSNQAGYVRDDAGAGDFRYAVDNGGTATDASVGRSSSIGSDTPHNNLQPYIVTYMWKRTA